ncbi:MAG: membrane dipeptidase, partial [Bacteroidota bacterium]
MKSQHPRTHILTYSDTQILITCSSILPSFLPFIFLVFCSSCSFLSTQQHQARDLSQEELVALAKGIHERTLTIDTHDDISADFATEKDDVGSPENRRQISLPKMRNGGLDVEFFVVFTGTGDRSAESFEAAYKTAIGRFDAIHRLPTRYPDQIDIALTPDDVLRINASGKLVACIGMENGYPVGTDLGRLKEFYDRGARYITLIHSGHNQICDSSTPREDGPQEEHGGLSEFGKQVVRDMNRLGMMIDISHASKKASLAVLALSKAPIIASHSGASAVNEHARNVDDETLRALKKNGGVVQVVSLAEYIKRRVDSPERQAGVAA